MRIRKRDLALKQGHVQFQMASLSRVDTLLLDAGVFSFKYYKNKFGIVLWFLKHCAIYLFLAFYYKKTITSRFADVLNFT